MRQGLNFNGAVLGEKQWAWLGETLESSAADVNIVVSSIQVLTTNPVVESWGHFPQEKARLLALLQRTDPSGLALVSGDVHAAELSSVSFVRADGSEGRWVEVTSSGLTHTCADNPVTALLCPLMMNLYSSHRLSHESANNNININNNDSFYIGRNYGTVRFSGSTVDLVVHSLEPGSRSGAVLMHQPRMHRQGGSRSPILSVSSKPFYSISIGVQLGLISLMLGLVYAALIVTLGRKFFYKKPKPKAQSKMGKDD